MSNQGLQDDFMANIEEKKEKLGGYNAEKSEQKSIKEQFSEFDLNHIFHLSYSFDLLKKVIEKIVDELDSQQKQNTNNFSHLKEQIRHETGQLKYDLLQHDQKLNTLSSKIDSTSSQCLDNATKTDQNKQEIDQIKHQLDQIVHKPDYQYDDSVMKQKIFEVEDRLKYHGHKLSDLEGRMLNFKSGGNGGIDMETFTDILNQLKEDMQDRFVRQEEFKEFKLRMDNELEKKQMQLDTHKAVSDDHEFRIKTLEMREIKTYDGDLEKMKELFDNYVKENEDRVQLMSERIKDLQRDITGKVDCEMFDEEINQLKNLINGLATDDKSQITQIINNIPQVSSKDSNKIKEMGLKLQDLEDIISKLLRDMKTLNISELREQVADAHKKLLKKVERDEYAEFKNSTEDEIGLLQDKMKPLLDKVKAFEQQILDNKDNILRITYRLDKLEASILSMKSELNEMKNLKQMSDKKQSVIDTPKLSSNMDEEFNDIHKQLLDLQIEQQKLRSDVQKALSQMQDQLLSKASVDQLNELESKLLEKMNELFQALMNKFADKNELKKTIKQIESQLKNLYDLLMSLKPQTHQENEDDAMFVKKPLGGWSCASCEKNIINLQGHIADYHPWKGLPFKDPQERIAKVFFFSIHFNSQYGAGFSKMLSMIKTDTSHPTSQPHYSSTNQLLNQSQGGISKEKPSPRITIGHDEAMQTMEVSQSQQNLRQMGPRTSNNFYKSHQNSAENSMFPNLRKVKRSKDKM